MQILVSSFRYFFLFGCIALWGCKTNSDTSRTLTSNTELGITGPVVPDPSTSMTSPSPTSTTGPTPSPTVLPPPSSGDPAVNTSSCLTMSQYLEMGYIPPYSLPSNSTTSTCDPCQCQGIRKLVEDTVNFNNSPQLQAMPPVAVDDKGTMSDDDFMKKWAECAKIGNLVWEDEKDTNAGLTPDTAFNCRDFSLWFKECMTRSGIKDVAMISVGCKDCASGDPYHHAINLVRKPSPDGSPGPWCPYEPQSNNPVRGMGGYVLCCDSDKDAAIKCANEVYCSRLPNWGADVCCVADSALNIDIGEKYKNELCRFIVQVDGVDTNGNPIKVQKLDCAGPEPISCKPMDNSIPKDGQPQNTPCGRSVAECLSKNPASCLDCKKDGFFDCLPRYPVNIETKYYEYCRTKILDQGDCSSCCDGLKTLALIDDTGFLDCTSWCNDAQFRRCRADATSAPCDTCCLDHFVGDAANLAKCKDMCKLK
jgi:hypothetical protein